MEQNLQILKAKGAQDYIDLASLAKLIWEEHYLPIIGIEQTNYMIDTFQSKAAIKDQIENQNMQYYFLEFNNQKIGYIAFRKDENSVFLSKYYVQKEYRGKGVGRAALDFVVSYAQQNQKSKIWLTVNRANEISIDQYKAMGFLITKEQDAQIGQGYFMNDYIMELFV